MRHIGKNWSILTPMLALAATGTSAGGGEGPPRAIGLEVEENESSVEIQLVARSATTQRVEYAIELVGSSQSRHRGSTTISANERSVLSRLSTGFADTWCAIVDVTEGDGTSYTLTAGDCVPEA